MNGANSTAGRPPRVVMIDDFAFPYRVPFFLHLARQAVDLTVLFCTSRIKSRRWPSLKVSGFAHEFLPGRVLYLKRGLHQERAIFLTPTLLFRLLALRPDVVIAYAYSIPTIIAFIYCRLAGKSFISWADGTPHTNQSLRFEQKCVRRLIIPRSDACITPSPDGRESFRSYGAHPDKVWMIPHAAAPEIGEMAETARGRHQTVADRLAIKKPRALYVGSLLAQKGVCHLLEAVARAQQTLGTDIHLIIAGEGPLRTDLEAQAQQLGIARNVRFLGFVQPDELPSVYAAADLFLFPSLNDTFAFVIGEAVRCGLPVVGSKFAGASKVLIEPGKNGFIVDPTDLAAFSNAIVQVLCDDEKRANMSVKSREIADRFSIEEAVKNCVCAINTTLARPRTCHPSTAEMKRTDTLQTGMRA
jgi:glycosyltransferase involved in cell wall biosynthesis